MLIRFCQRPLTSMPHEPAAASPLISCALPSQAPSSQPFNTPKRWRVRLPRSLTLTLSLSEFVPDLQPPWHAQERKCLSGLVNQS
jgi:hypothetical protein